MVACGTFETYNNLQLTSFQWDNSIRAVLFGVAFYSDPLPGDLNPLK